MFGYPRGFFEITGGFRIIFPKILDVIDPFMTVRIFLIPLSIMFLNPKFLVSFFYEKQHYLGSEMWNIKLQKIVGNLLHMSRKMCVNGTVI